MTLERVLATAYAAWEAQDWDAAAGALTRAVRLPEGDRREYWFDLALVHKFRRDWPAAVQAGLATAERGVEPSGDPTWWNLGIAATALHDWRLARRAWRGFGVELDEDGGTDDGPIEQDFGITPVRLGGDEVVWARRLCPTRARVLSVPLPDSGRRWGEVVLHDGVPNGERVWEGRTYPVFDEIQLFEPSFTPTFVIDVDAADDDIDALLDRFGHAGLGAENVADVRVLCKECSEGTVDDSHHHERGERGRVLVAAPAEEIEATLADWRSVDPAGRRHGVPERML